MQTVTCEKTNITLKEGDIYEVDAKLSSVPHEKWLILNIRGQAIEYIHLTDKFRGKIGLKSTPYGITSMCHFRQHIELTPELRAKLEVMHQSYHYSHAELALNKAMEDYRLALRNLSLAQEALIQIENNGMEALA